MKPDIVIVCGATATGKTECAIRIAKRFSGDVVNADSMQVYRGMETGTAKPTPAQRAEVPFHLVDVADPSETFSTGRFKTLADQAIAGIVSRGNLPVIAGGTGLYLKALTRGLFEGPKADPGLRDRLNDLEKNDPGCLHARLMQVDSQKAQALPPTDVGRIVRALEVFELTGTPLSEHQKQHGFASEHYRSLWIGLELDRETLYDRINQRVVRMIEAGWVREVVALREAGFDEGSAAGNALGYRTLMDHLRGGCSLPEAIERIQTETRKFAKRQLTWYRANPHIHWFAYPEQVEAIVDRVQKEVFDWQPVLENSQGKEGK